MKILILILVLTSITCQTSIYQPINTCELIPKDLENADTMEGQIITHNHYQLCYSNTYQQSLWVSYMLTKNEIEKKYDRVNKFIPDPLLRNSRNQTNDYYKSGYDRGHLIPAAVCSFDSIAMYESFYYSNVSPMTPSFNRGIWAKLEKLERSLVVKYDTVYVTVLPIFENIIDSIGMNKILVPGAFSRSLLVKDSGNYKAVGYILENRSYSKYYDVKKVGLVTIDSIEKIVKINLYYQLCDSISVDVESKVSIEILEGL